MNTKYIRLLEKIFSSNPRPLFDLVTASPLAICITDAEGRFTFANRAYCHLYGYPLEDLIGQEFTLVVQDHFKEVAWKMHRNFIETGSDNLGAGEEDMIGEWIVIDRGGNRKVIQAEALRITDDLGNPYKVTFVVDVTGHKETERGLLKTNAKLAFMADHDMLMSIFNRRAGLEIMEREMLAARRTGRQLCIALIDIDHFKAVNDTYGHRVGDQVLSVVAARLSDNMRKADTLVRYGGEELLIIMPASTCPEAKRAVERLLSLVSGTPVSERAISVTFSGGIAEYNPGLTADRLLERADMALYKAKEQRNRIAVWSESCTTLDR